MMTLVLVCDRCEVEFRATDYKGVQYARRILADARRQGWSVDGRGEICPGCSGPFSQPAPSAPEGGDR
jgi:hypothetical protein